MPQINLFWAVALTTAPSQYARYNATFHSAPIRILTKDRMYGSPYSSTKTLIRSAAPHHFEQCPFTRTPRVLLQDDMSHHFTVIICHLQSAQAKPRLPSDAERLSSRSGLALLTSGKNLRELPRRAAGLWPNELVPIAVWP